MSKGQPVGLCWGLEPAADVLLCSGCFPMAGGGEGESPLNPLELVCSYAGRAVSLSGGDGSFSQR